MDKGLVATNTEKCMSIEDARAYFAAASRRSRKRKLDREIFLERSTEFYQDEISHLQYEVRSLQSEISCLEKFNRDQTYMIEALRQETLNESLKDQVMEYRYLASQCKAFFNSLESKMKERDYAHSLKCNLAFLIQNIRSKHHQTKMYSPVKSIAQGTEMCRDYEDLRMFLTDNLVRNEDDERVVSLNFMNLKHDFRMFVDGNHEGWSACDIYNVPISRAQLFKALKDVDTISQTLVLDRKKMRKKSHLLFTKVFLKEPMQHTPTRINEIQEELQEYFPQVKEIKWTDAGLMLLSSSYSSEEDGASYIISTVLPTPDSNVTELDSYGTFFTRSFTLTDGAEPGTCNIHSFSSLKWHDTSLNFHMGDEKYVNGRRFTEKMKRAGFSGFINRKIKPQDTLKHIETIIKATLLYKNSMPP